ncbi:MAG: T9SS type A sorting domain-containing protein [candidate division WOR-3 bacterium]
MVPDASSYLPILSWTPNIRQIPIQIVSPARYLAFSFYLPKEEKVSLYLFDQTGRKVREIYKGFLSSGEHQFKENAKLSAGVYFLNLNIGEKNLMKKLVIIN